MVRNIRPGSASSQPLFLTNVNGTLFFTAKDGRHGRELWRAGPAVQDGQGEVQEGVGLLVAALDEKQLSALHGKRVSG